MQRRAFSLSAATVAAATLGGTAALPSFAQGKVPQEGTDYLLLDKPAPTEAPAGKIEVVEFFSYNCPHCNDFEPALEAWAKTTPKEVAFRRIPVPFVGNDVEAKQRLYYALEALGKVDEFQPKVFNAIHKQRQNVNGDANIIAWVAANGIDGTKFKEVFTSFGVASKAKRASQMTDAYKVAGVPAMAVAGRWYVDGETAGNMTNVLQVVNYLVTEAKKG